MVHCYVYVAVNERAEVHNLLVREALIEKIGGSECAGLCGDSELGSVEVVPDLYGDETDEKR